MPKPKIIIPKRHILGPDGQPAFFSEVARRNRDNRARLRARIGPWQRSFKVGEQYTIRKIRFTVREIHDDLMVLGNPLCMDEDRKWYERFSHGDIHSTIFPIRGWEFIVQEVYFNSLHLLCRGPTGQRRKGRWTAEGV